MIWHKLLSMHSLTSPKQRLKDSLWVEETRQLLRTYSLSLNSQLANNKDQPS